MTAVYTHSVEKQTG